MMHEIVDGKRKGGRLRSGGWEGYWGILDGVVDDIHQIAFSVLVWM